MAPATIPELAKIFQSGDFNHYIKLHHTPKDCDVINDLTKGQSFSPALKEYRLGRITTSRAHRIIKCRGNGEYITRDILGESTFRGNTATEHVSHAKDLPGNYMKNHTVEWKHPDWWLIPAYHILALAPMVL